MGDATAEYCKECDTQMIFDGDSYYCPKCIEKPGVDAFDYRPTIGAEKLAEDHWSYIDDVLSLAGRSQLQLDEIGFHYKSAFIHGYKHAKEGD